MAYSFVLTGGGTGGHVFPALAVGRVLRERGHRLLFVGTPGGIESRLVPEAGFEMAAVRSSGLNRVGFLQALQTVSKLPLSVVSAGRILRNARPAAVFSMGGYAAGPVMVAAILARIPLVVMEPNIIPGFANRQVSRWIFRALIGFEHTAQYFPNGRSELTGLPVREEFFCVPGKTDGTFTVLLTGGSRGANSLNEAARESWPLFAASQSSIRLLHQSGAADHTELEAAFKSSGLAGEVVPFFPNMANAFAEADLVVSRSGAGAVNEIAAAGMASLLVPFPFAADDHQRKNAEALASAGAARIIDNTELSGRRLFEEVQSLLANGEELKSMRQRVRIFAHPNAAGRAADVLEEAAGQTNHSAFRPEGFTQ